MEMFAQRARELVAQMTLEEKVSQMRYDAPAIERLGIPAYNWWNECLHGVGRSGTATVFPQPIGMAASSAIIKRITIWNGDILDNSDFPMSRTAKRTAAYRIRVRIATINKCVPPCLKIFPPYIVYRFEICYTLILRAKQKHKA